MLCLIGFELNSRWVPLIFLNFRLKFYLELDKFFPFDNVLWSTFHVSRIIHIMCCGWITVSS